MDREAEEEDETEDENGELPLPTSDGQPRKSGRRWKADDSPLATVSMLVLACWTMRVPVIYMDFVK